MEFLKEQNQSTDTEVIVKIYENAIKAMIQEKKDWTDIEKKCNYLLNNYSDTNHIALDILLQIYSEILIGNYRTDQNSLFLHQYLIIWFCLENREVYSDLD